MSDNVLNQNEGFFSSSEVPDSFKMAAVALLLKGTYNVYTSPNGKAKTIVSMVYRKGGK